MRPLPTWLVASALVLIALGFVWSYLLDGRRNRPLEWDPAAWRAWLHRTDATAAHRARLRRRRRLVSVQRFLHPRRRRSRTQRDLARGLSQLTSALDRHDGRLFA